MNIDADVIAAITATTVLNNIRFVAGYAPTTLEYNAAALAPVTVMATSPKWSTLS